MVPVEWRAIRTRLRGESNMKVKTNIRVGLRKCGPVLA
jgi:hypothetical protein